MPNTILLAGTPFIPQEKVASEPITPGHLVEFVLSGGDAGQLRRHATANGNANPYFAIENLTPDRTVATAPIDTPYADGESMRWISASKCEVYAWVPANAAAIVAGDNLASNGDGTLKKAAAAQAVNEGGTATYTLFTRAIVAVAAEAVNNSANGSAARIRVYPVG